MNNSKSKAREPDVRRLAALLLLAVFCVALFAAPAAAGDRDPNRWTIPYMHSPAATPEGDDGVWQDQQKEGGWRVGDLLGCCDIRVTAPSLFLWFFDLMDVTDVPDSGNGNDRQSLDQSRRASPQ